MSSDQEDIQSQVNADSWGKCNEMVIDHITNPRNVGSIPDNDGFGSVSGSCCDTMEIWIKVNDGGIHRATFWTDG